MAQLQKGTTYTGTGTSSFVTHTNLNAHVDNARLVGGAIDEQVENTISSDSDLILINKGGSLFKQTKVQFTQDINSNTIRVNQLSVETGEFDEIETASASIDEDLTVGGDIAIEGDIVINGQVTGDLNVSGVISSQTAPTENDHLVTKAYADGTANKATKGYVKLPNGIIFQWGVTAMMSPLSTAVQTFDIPFPTACLNVQATKITTGDYFGNKKDTHAVYQFTLTGFTMFNQHEQSWATYNWFAIGY